MPPSSTNSSPTSAAPRADERAGAPCACRCSHSNTMHTERLGPTKPAPAGPQSVGQALHRFWSAAPILQQAGGEFGQQPVDQNVQQPVSQLHGNHRRGARRFSGVTTWTSLRSAHHLCTSQFPQPGRTTRIQPRLLQYHRDNAHHLDLDDDLVGALNPLAAAKQVSLVSLVSDQVREALESNATGIDDFPVFDLPPGARLFGPNEVRAAPEE